MASKKIILKSKDGAEFAVDEAVALQSQAIKNLMEDSPPPPGSPIPLIVTSNVLAKVIEYCKKHAVDGNADDLNILDDEEELNSWDADFIKVDQATLFDLIHAADYMNIQGLLNLTCQAVANLMAGKTVEEVRETFNITNDYSATEEDAVRGETPWAFR